MGRHKKGKENPAFSLFEGETGEISKKVTLCQFEVRDEPLNVGFSKEFQEHILLSIKL